MIWIVIAVSIIGVTSILTYALAVSAGKASREEWRREQLQRNLEAAAQVAERMAGPLPDDDDMDEWVRDNE